MCNILIVSSSKSGIDGKVSHEFHNFYFIIIIINALFDSIAAILL